MKVLYSNMLPLGIQDNQETIDESIKQQIAKSDRVDIAVGYVSLPISLYPYPVVAAKQA